MAAVMKPNFLRMEVDESIVLQCPGCNLRGGCKAHRLRETRFIFQLPAEAATVDDVKHAFAKTFSLSVGIDILFEDRLFLPSVSVKALLALLAGSGGFVRIRPHNQFGTPSSILSSGSLIGTSSGYEANDKSGTNSTTDLANVGFSNSVSSCIPIDLTVSENDQSHSHTNSSLDTMVASSPIRKRKITATSTELSGTADSLHSKYYDCYSDLAKVSKESSGRLISFLQTSR